jgi:hypothetical protein
MMKHILMTWNYRNINPLTPNDLQRRRAVSPLQIKIPSKNSINEMHGSRSKIPSKKSRQAALRGGI